ncbi:MAG: hypothetical protein ACLQT6_16455 [Desulfomonilaceae bacterium]
MSRYILSSSLTEARLSKSLRIGLMRIQLNYSAFFHDATSIKVPANLKEARQVAFRDRHGDLMNSFTFKDTKCKVNLDVQRYVKPNGVIMNKYDQETGKIKPMK